MKAIKWVLISLSGLVVLAGLAIGGALWFVFTPERLTPLVNQQAKEFLTCDARIERVEMVFFSTFPHFSLRLKEVCVVNPTTGAPSDTLLSCREASAGIDVAEFWNNNRIVLNYLTLEEAQATLFADSTGRANYLIVKETTPYDTTESGLPFELIRLNQIRLVNSNIRYLDQGLKMDVTLRGTNLALNGEMNSQAMKGDLSVQSPDVTFRFDQDTYIKNRAVALETALTMNLDDNAIQIDRALLDYQKSRLTLSGNITPDTKEGYDMNLNYAFSTDSIGTLLAALPESYAKMMEGMHVDGQTEVKGMIAGRYNEKSLPLVSAEVTLKNGTFVMDDKPNWKADQINCSALLAVNMNQPKESYVELHEVSASALRSTFRLTGTVRNLMNDPRFKGSLNGKVDLRTISQEFLREMGYDLDGIGTFSLWAEGSQSDLTKGAYERLKLKGSAAATAFRVENGKDTLAAKADRLNLQFETSANSFSGKKRFVSGNLETSGLTGKMGKSMQLSAESLHLDFGANDFRDTTKVLDVECRYQAKRLLAAMDDMNLRAEELDGELAMTPSSRNAEIPVYSLALNGKTIKGAMGKERIDGEAIQTKIRVAHNEKEKDKLLQWIPTGTLRIENTAIHYSGTDARIYAPILDLSLTPSTLGIKQSRLTVDGSDLQLEGEIKNYRKYLRGSAPLKGELSLKSDRIDISRLMELTSATTGSEEENNEPQPAPAPTPSQAEESSPFLVPTNVDLILKTQIKEALYGNTPIRDIRGDVIVKEGKLVLDDLSLISPGGRMKLTLLYRTPRKNHLYAGINFHLMEVEIKELIRMFPDIDSMMPMLRSFGGRGEFHAIAQTYMDSTYNFKRSTMRGGFSLSGNNLVLMDGETFSEIAKMLQFNKKTINKIDSISAEATLYKNDIDIFPFQIVMDKYKAVVSGRHNLDMSFNYHISVTDCPLPIRLGVDVAGTLDKLNIKLAPCRYANLYRPVARKTVENEQLSLRKLIRESLMQDAKDAPKTP